MRDPERIGRICTNLERLWNECPDLRLGQLLEAYVFDNHIDGRIGCIFYQEDDITEERIREQLNIIEVKEC